MPTLDGVLETALYVDDLDRAHGFYAEILGLTVLVRDDRMCASAVGDRSVLLIFQRGAQRAKRSA
jgi:catechol-2,3-dioxygenase